MNQIHASAAIMMAAAIGVALKSWWVFGVGLAILLGLNTWGGSIRLAPARQPTR